ncbi:MAG: hypothetical protein GX033_08075 [Firmicutes bacterium]|nr:hypothetical protein [Bacillota bacterium]
MWNRARGPEPEDREQLDDRRRITWREFLLICATMYRQILPGTLVLAAAMLLLIILLQYMAG